MIIRQCHAIFMLVYRGVFVGQIFHVVVSVDKLKLTNLLALISGLP